MSFTIQIAQDNQVVKAVKAPKVVLPILRSYAIAALEKIEQSISDAKGRYELGHAYADPKKSQNWKVIANAAQKVDGEISKTALGKEIVRVWLNVGQSKIVIGKNQEGKEVDYFDLTSAQLVPTLEQMKTMVEAVRDGAGLDAEVVYTFHSMAIARSIGPSRPKGEGVNTYAYDAEQDLWIAVFSDDGEKLDNQLKDGSISEHDHAEAWKSIRLAAIEAGQAHIR